jgi:hypothetical protein
MPRSCPRPQQLNNSAIQRFLTELPKEVARLVAEGKPREIVGERRWAETLRYAAKRAKLGKEAQDACAEARFRLERRLGEVIPPYLKKGRPKTVESDDHLRLADFGISKDLSARAQRIAAVRLAIFDQFFVHAQRYKWEITNAEFFYRCDVEQINPINRQRDELRDRMGQRDPDEFYYLAEAGRGRSRPRPGPAKSPSARGVSNDDAAPPTVQLRMGDCLDVMSEIHDRSIDLIATDLPYGRKALKWDQPLDLTALWRQYRRIIKPNRPIVLFGIQPFTSQLVMRARSVQVRDDLVQVQRRRFRSCSE